MDPVCHVMVPVCHGACPTENEKRYKRETSTPTSQSIGISKHFLTYQNDIHHQFQVMQCTTDFKPEWQSLQDEIDIPELKYNYR